MIVYCVVQIDVKMDGFLLAALILSLLSLIEINLEDIGRKRSVQFFCNSKYSAIKRQMQNTYAQSPMNEALAHDATPTVLYVFLLLPMCVLQLLTEFCFPYFLFLFFYFPFSALFKEKHIDSAVYLIRPNAQHLT